MQTNATIKKARMAVGFILNVERDRRGQYSPEEELGFEKESFMDLLTRSKK
jgi:hypothetical protein